MSAPVALISGGSRGLGAALVARFLEAGHSVAAFARGESPLVGGLRERFGHRLLFAALDGGDRRAVQRFVAQAVETLGGRIDVLVNNAAVGAESIFPLMPDDDIERTITTNLTGPMYLLHAVSRVMLRLGGGTVVNVSSVNALRGHAGVGVYSATKAALDGLTRSLARELGPKGIRVNSIAPGYFESGMTGGLDRDRLDRIALRTPLRRLGTVDDMCQAVLWLCSAGAAFVTGHVLVVDGGLTC